MQKNIPSDSMTDEEIQERVTELKINHPKFAAVVERISDLDLKETMKGYIAAEGVQRILKFHARNLVEDKLMYR